MLAKRIIPCLDVKDGVVVKGVKFRGHEVVGEIVPLAKRYAEEGADELVFYDITASSDGRVVDKSWISRVAEAIDIPFCVAGGIRTVEDAGRLLAYGADKISVNSPALADPDLISRLADRFGPLPRAAKELLNVVRLRWEAIRLGMERVKVKNGLMILHFVGEQNSPYYKSDTFMELLRKVTQNPARFVLKQHNNRLAMTVRNVKDIEDGYKTLQQL